jgi:hypothetical protein
MVGFGLAGTERFATLRGALLARALQGKNSLPVSLTTNFQQFAKANSLPKIRKNGHSDTKVSLSGA